MALCGSGYCGRGMTSVSVLGSGYCERGVNRYGRNTEVRHP